MIQDEEDQGAIQTELVSVDHSTEKNGHSKPLNKEGEFKLACKMEVVVSEVISDEIPIS